MEMTSPDPHPINFQTAYDMPAGLACSAKRAGDVLASIVLLFVLAPMLIVVAAVVYAHGDGGPICRRTRIGRDGRPFQCLSFRTGPTPDGTPRRRAGDPAQRNSAFGDLLRYTGAHVLPQIANVLLGDMSMVGPRPLSADELLHHGAESRWYLAMRPGITGPWQILHNRRITPEARTALDVDYVMRWSLRRDVAILMRTPFAALANRGSR